MVIRQPRYSRRVFRGKHKSGRVRRGNQVLELLRAASVLSEDSALLEASRVTDAANALSRDRAKKRNPTYDAVEETEIELRTIADDSLHKSPNTCRGISDASGIYSHSAYAVLARI